MKQNFQKKKLRNTSRNSLKKVVFFGMPIREVWLDTVKAGVSTMNNSAGLFAKHRFQPMEKM